MSYVIYSLRHRSPECTPLIVVGGPVVQQDGLVGNTPHLFEYLDSVVRGVWRRPVKKENYLMFKHG
jgi:hypothetical protein